MSNAYIRAQKTKKAFLTKRLYAVIALLLVAILLVSGVTYAWLVLSKAPEASNITATVGANGNLEIALATTDHLSALKANDMYDTEPNPEFTNGDLLHDNVLWGNLLDLSPSDYGLTTLDIRPTVLNVLDNHVADAPISAVKYGTDGRPEKLTTDPSNPDIDTLGFTGIYNVNKGGYYAGSLAMSIDDLKSGNFDKAEVIQSILDARNYGVRIAGLLDYNAGVDAEQTVANIDLMIDGYCFAIDMLFRTNSPNANLLLQTAGADRVEDEDYEYLLDFSGGGSYLDMSEKKLSTAMRVVFADTVTGQVYALAQPDVYGNLLMTARLDENGELVVVKPGDDQLIKPLTENQVSAITAWVYLDGMQADNSYAAIAAATAMKLNLQFATDMDLTPSRPDGNGEIVRPDTPGSGETDPAQWTYYLKKDAGNNYTIHTQDRSGHRPYELSVTGSLDSDDKTFVLNKVQNYPANGVIIPSVVVAEDFSEYTVQLDADSRPFASLGTEEASLTFAAIKGKPVELNSQSTGDLLETDEGTTFVSLDIAALDVTTIDKYAFYDFTSLKSVSIPSSVTTIGNEAFYDCYSLASVYISDVAAWCAIDFAGLYSNPLYHAKNLYLNGELVTDLVIPDSVTTIGEYAFYWCTSLTSVTIPDSVTTIGDYAFDYCTSLTSVTIPDSVTTIGDYAFYGCTSLTSVTIGDSVTTIGDYAFYDCDALTSVTIGDSVTTIGDLAFGNCDALTSIDVDDNNPNYCDVDGVLFNKEKTTLIQYPGGKTGAYTIPDSVTTIGSYAFRDCDALTSVTIGDSVTTIGDGAFYDCNALTAVTIGDSVTTIGESAFYDCDALTSVTIPNSVTTIGDWAFEDCDALTSVTIGDSVTSIGDYAFAYCDSLTSVTIPNSVTTIGDWAFEDCDALTSVTIGDSVTTIGSHAFYVCDALTSVYISDVAAWCGIDFADYVSNPLYYAKNLYVNGELVTDLMIPDSVTTIGSSAFSSCYSLTSVTIPDSVTTIGDSAFCNCSTLTSVTIGDSVTTIGYKAFSSCYDLTSVTIGDSVTTIGSSAFSGCYSLTSVTIPDSVTTIGDYAFYDCDALTSVTIGDSVTTIGDRAFYDCDALTSVTMGDSVTTIGDYAFRYCRSLTYVVLPSSVTKIGSYAFDYCDALTDVYYAGSKDDRNNITIYGYNSPLRNATWHYNTSEKTEG